MSIKCHRIALTPVGANGSAVATRTVGFNGAGIIKAITVNYTSMPTTTDVTIYADSSTGRTLLSLPNNNLDFPVGYDSSITIPQPENYPLDDAFVKSGVYIDVAQADSVADGIVIEVWLEI